MTTVISTAMRRVRRAIIDKDVHVPEGETIGSM